MINKKGFVFIETIITTLVLLTTILVLYAAYSTSINGEKKRLYYDDIAYIYRTEFIARVINKSIDLSKFQENVINRNSGSSGDTNINTRNNRIYAFNYRSNIWHEVESNEAEEIIGLYNAYMLFYIPFKVDGDDNISSIKKIIKEKGNCNKSTDDCKVYNHISLYGEKTFADYLLTLDVEPIAEADGILVVIYRETKNGNPFSQGYAACKASHEALGHNMSDYSMSCETADYISWVYFKAGA